LAAQPDAKAINRAMSNDVAGWISLISFSFSERWALRGLPWAKLEPVGNGN